MPGRIHPECLYDTRNSAASHRRPVALLFQLAYLDSMTETARRPDPAGRPAPRRGGIAARALAARGAPWLEKLNPEQRQAVETTEGPLLVLAGAGTGKTRVLTTRIAHILATGRAWPSQILAVTFTNKAAREMKKRVGRPDRRGRAEGMPWLGTFHSIGVKILRRHAELVGLRADFTILDTDDQVRLLKQIISADEHRREALAGAPARRRDRRLEEPRADAGQSARRRGLRLRQRQGPRALRRIPGSG